MKWKNNICVRVAVLCILTRKMSNYAKPFVIGGNSNGLQDFTRWRNERAR